MSGWGPDDCATRRKEQVWEKQTGFGVRPAEGDPEGIWWETSPGKSLSRGGEGWVSCLCRLPLLCTQWMSKMPNASKVQEPFYDPSRTVTVAALL